MIIFVSEKVPPVTLIKIKKSILIFTLDDVDRHGGVKKKVVKSDESERKKSFSMKIYCRFMES